MNYGVHSHKIFHLPDLPVLKTKVKYGKIEMLNEFVSIAPLHNANVPTFIAGGPDRVQQSQEVQPLLAPNHVIVV